MAEGAADTIHAVTGLTARERVPAFDLAAGLAVFFMILVHVLWNWGSPDASNSPLGRLISYPAGPTATPTFLFLMGASLGAARRASHRALVVRGLWLVALGYLLNVLRGALPLTLGLNLGVITLDRVAPITQWSLLTSVDLHHVVGLSLVAIALLRARLEPGRWWLVGAVGLGLIAPLLRGFSTGIPVIDGPLTPFIGAADNVFYAVVPWLAFPLGGAVLGRRIATSGDPTRTLRRGALLGAGLLAVGGALIVLQQPSFDVHTYWRMPFSFLVGIFGVILVWLWLCDVVTRRPAIDRHLGIVYGWSHRVIAMYFTHWLIVGWGIGLVGYHMLTLDQALVGMAVAVVITHHASKLVVNLESVRWLPSPNLAPEPERAALAESVPMPVAAPSGS
jgi:uncharacterized membrane protein